MKRLILLAAMCVTGCNVTDGAPKVAAPKPAPKIDAFPELAAFLADEKTARDGSPQDQVNFAKKWVGKRASFSGLVEHQWQDQHSRMVHVSPSDDRYAPHLTVFFLPDEFPPMRMRDSAIFFECVITSFNPLGCIAESVKRHKANQR